MSWVKHLLTMIRDPYSPSSSLCPSISREQEAVTPGCVTSCQRRFGTGGPTTRSFSGECWVSVEEKPISPNVGARCPQLSERAWRASRMCEECVHTVAWKGNRARESPAGRARCPGPKAPGLSRIELSQYPDFRVFKKKTNKIECERDLLN